MCVCVFVQTVSSTNAIETCEWGPSLPSRMCLSADWPLALVWARRVEARTCCLQISAWTLLMGRSSANRRCFDDAAPSPSPATNGRTHTTQHNTIASENSNKNRAGVHASHCIGSQHAPVPSFSHRTRLSEPSGQFNRCVPPLLLFLCPLTHATPLTPKHTFSFFIRFISTEPKTLKRDERCCCTLHPASASTFSTFIHAYMQESTLVHHHTQRRAAQCVRSSFAQCVRSQTSHRSQTNKQTNKTHIPSAAVAPVADAGVVPAAAAFVPNL